MAGPLAFAVRGGTFPVGFLRETAAVLARIGERINEDAQKAG